MSYLEIGVATFLITPLEKEFRFFPPFSPFAFKLLVFNLLCMWAFVLELIPLPLAFIDASLNPLNS